MRRPLLLLTLLFSLASLLAPPAAAADLDNPLRQLIRAHDLRQTQVAVMVMDLDTGEVLAALDADEPMIPASNMKLLTTAASLDVLGPDFVFRTQLALLPPADGSTAAQLAVLGDGDPAFADPVLLKKHGQGLSVDDLLNQWVQAVRATGIPRFDQLLIDDRVFDRQFVHPTWPADQLIRDYCAGVAGVNFHRNCIDVLLLPAEQRGLSPRVELYPPAPFLQTTNQATTGDSDQYWITRRPGTNEFTFGGTVQNRPWGPTSVSVHDPALFFGQVLAHRLAAAGIEVAHVARPADEARLDTLRPLHIIQTTLPVVLERTNQDSQNMFAEALFKRMGRAVTGAPGDWDNGAAAVRIFLRNRLGPRSAVARIFDGSGMSRDNRVTARLMVDLLRSMHEDPDPRKAQIFRRSLAHAGVNGTLDNRMKDLQGEVFAKTGYLREVSSLSGYLLLPPSTPGQPPRTIAFSFLFNGFKPPLYNAQMKDLQNKLVRTIETALLAAPVGNF